MQRVGGNGSESGEMERRGTQGMEERRGERER